LIGRALVKALRANGHEVVPIVRYSPAPGEGYLNLADKVVDLRGVHDVDAVVHLAGEPLLGRWSSQKKELIKESRVVGTKLLAEAVAKLDPLPSVMISASAIGYYGDRGDEELTEESAPGHGFLAEVCVEWENATAPATEAGIRVVNLRTGIVLAKDGGSLQLQLPLFRMGLGTRLGKGDQQMSWVSLEDEVGAIIWALSHDEIAGPLNATAPHPVSNAIFTEMLAKILHRPVFFSAPKPFLQLVAGKEATEEMLLVSQRVLPTKLLSTGYHFKSTELEDGLRTALIG
jgi:uncharacterized protein (TIGR01777 family)